MVKVMVEGKWYKVLEDLGYQPGAGRVKIVETDNGNKSIVRENCLWRWWTAKDKIKPISRWEGQNGKD
jgi:hypothetical protein